MNTTDPGRPNFPIADWTDVSCEDGVIRGTSSVSGPFELPVAEIVAIGQHYVWEDEPMSLGDSWTTVLTHDEYGFVSETVPGYIAFLETVDAAIRGLNQDELPAPLAWHDCMRRTSESRLIYPPWVHGFHAYEWPNGWDSDPAIGRAVCWLLDDDSREQQRQWHSFASTLPRCEVLGKRRAAFSWQHRYDTTAGFLLFFAALLLAVSFSPRGSLLFQVLATGILLGSAILVWPSLASTTTVHDGGVRLRRWFFLTERCYYDDIEEMKRGEYGPLTIHQRNGQTLRIPTSHGKPEGIVNDLARRSRALRYATENALPFA